MVIYVACVYETPDRYTNPMASVARVSCVARNQEDDVVGTDGVAERTP